MSDDKKNDEMIRSLRDAERARRKRAMIGGSVVAALAVAAVVISVVFSDEMFQPEIDVASGERAVRADTHDPHCRARIAQVTTIGRDYRAWEPELQDEFLGDERAELQEHLATLESYRERLDAAEQLAGQAELRFDTSRGELDEWFSYVDNELRLLHILGTERLAALAQAGGPDAGSAAGADGGTLVAAPAKESTSTKTPQERLDGATLAVNEAFQKFRVWHTGSLHPCGKAAEGETPWAPAAPAVSPAPAQP